jgi:protein TonB
MSVEERREHKEFGALGGCFVGGDAEQRRRERKIKRRALALSIVFQALALAAIILVPLFGKPDHIAYAGVIPVPPYYPAGRPTRVNNEHVVRPTADHHFQLNYPNPNAPLRPTTDGGDGSQDPNLPEGPVGPGPVGLPCTAGCIDIGVRNPGPRKPPETPEPPKRVSGHLDPAMLTKRIEPTYPNLAKQIHREGKVELHAIIGTDGTIQELRVISGDVMFYQSAMDAVRQWRYKPTYLSGTAVEVDTTITVIYTLAH